MCLCFWENLLIGGFTNGQIVIYNSDSGAKAIEITAHARSINALDVAPDSGLVRSLSGGKSFPTLPEENPNSICQSLTTKPGLLLE